VAVFNMDALKKRVLFDAVKLLPPLAVGLCVEVLVLVPAHMVLTRVQASLLSADEKMIVSMDQALRRDGDGRKCEPVGMRGAWRTFGWRAWGRLEVLYGQVFVVVLVGGGATLAVA
jgi:hypothetical protein